MRHVAIDAPVHLLWRVGVDERTGLFGVAVEANSAAADHGQAALAIVAVHRVAIGALEGSSAVAVSVRHLERTRLRKMALGTELVGRRGQEMVGLQFAVPSSMAVKTGNTVADVGRGRDIGHSLLPGVAAEACTRIREAIDVFGCGVVDMFGGRAMTADT